MSATNDLIRLGFYCSSFVLFLLLGISSYTDWKSRKIYNKVTVPSAVLGLVIASLTNFPSGLQNAALACGLGFALFFALFLLGMMGGGDVKLVAAIGALTGFPFILDALFFGILTGGVYAVALLACKGGLWQNVKNVFLFIWGLLFWRMRMPLETNNSIKIPYGLCLSVGTAVAFILKHVVKISQNSLVLGY